MTNDVQRSCSNCKGFRPGEAKTVASPVVLKGECRMGLPQLYGVLVPTAPKQTMGPGGIIQAAGPPGLMIQERSGFPTVEANWDCENWKAKDVPND